MKGVILGTREKKDIFYNLGSFYKRVNGCYPANRKVIVFVELLPLGLEMVACDAITSSIYSWQSA